METKSQRPKELDGTLSSLNTAIGSLDQAGGTTSVKPAKDAFRSASLLLIAIRVCKLFSSSGWPVADWGTQDSTMIKEMDCVELGLACAEVCQALNQGIHGRRQGQLSRPVLQAIERLKA